MDYRLYVLDSVGRFADVEEWNCPSDVEAMAQATRHAHAFGAELWQGARRLSTLAGPLEPRTQVARG